MMMVMMMMTRGNPKQQGSLYTRLLIDWSTAMCVCAKKKRGVLGLVIESHVCSTLQELRRVDPSASISRRSLVAVAARPGCS